MLSKTIPIVTAILFTEILCTNISKCRKSEFQCKNGDCININKHCNGLKDCPDGSDEVEKCSPCNMTYFGDVGYTYELEIKRPNESEIPFLCFLNFTAAGGSFGELVQLTFEAFSVGTFESFTSDGCPDGHISIKEAHRPSSGGKWCGSTWGYTVYYSETPSVNLTLSLNRFSQQQTSGYTFEFKVSYKFLKMSDAKIRYGNATQRIYRGKLVAGSYCDRMLENCSRRPCKIQSPNYPGIYPRNISCNYKVREKNIPPGKHALISIRQSSFHHKEPLSKFQDNDRMLKIWDQCNMMQDYIEILDGWGPSATVLAHLCSGETVPEIISSGPEMLVKFHTSPFGNPFHPLPLSYLPGFELEIEVFYVTKESPTYIEQGKKCDFLVTSHEKTIGFLESPLHSLPPNTTCHYHFRGPPNSIIWISFIKYHVTNEKLTNFNTADCDVQLQIWDGDTKSNKNNVQLMGQFCKFDKPKLCDHSLLRNNTRLTRPCSLPESYTSTSTDLTISHSIKHGSVLYPVNFILRYEFVDLSQEGAQVSRNPCDRILKTDLGRFYSPKITFLFGRGGQSDLTCTYQFVAKEDYRLKITFNKASFGDKDCSTELNSETNRWTCIQNSKEKGIAFIKISEYPFEDIEIKRDCFCTNITDQFEHIVKTSSKIVVTFHVSEMKLTEDFHDYNFDANFEFIPTENCLNPWQSRRVKGNSGEIVIRNENSNNNTLKYCLDEPWLIEPQNSLQHYIYLKLKGTEVSSTRICYSKNRILIYSPGRTEEIQVICPQYENLEEVELFSVGWNIFNFSKMQNLNSKSFLIEFLQKESGNFGVAWMEVSKNPALSLPSSLLVIAPPDCPHSCPELGACISEDLWCDGLRHCPSGNDEQEENCAVNSWFLLKYINPISLITAGVVISILIISVSIYFYRQWKNDQNNVIVSVTEHTFFEFKAGLC